MVLSETWDLSLMPRKTKRLSGSDSVETSRRKSAPSYWLYRTKQPCEVPPWQRGHLAPETCLDLFDAKRTLLGAEQEQWLFDQAIRCCLEHPGQLVAQLRQKTKAGEPAFCTDAGMATAAHSRCHRSEPPAQSCLHRRRYPFVLGHRPSPNCRVRGAIQIGTAPIRARTRFGNLPNKPLQISGQIPGGLGA